MLQEKVAQIPMVATPTTLPSLSQPAPMALQSVGRGREDSGLVYTWFYMTCMHLKVGNCSTTAPLWAIPEGQW